MSNRILPGLIARDVFFGGDGYVAGTTKNDGTPTDTPVSRKVRLFDMKSGQIVREKWSGADGVYQFNNVLRGDHQKYFVVSHDHTENYNAVIADRIAAEPLTGLTPSGIILDAYDSGEPDGVKPGSIGYWTANLLHFDGAIQGAGGDPYWDKVSLLIHAEGSNGSASFTDEKGKTVSNLSLPVITTSTFAVGASSADMSGGWLTVPAGSDFDFGAGDFTLEAWVNPNAGRGNISIVFDYYGGVSNRPFRLSIGSGATPNISLLINNSSIATSANGAITNGVWQHVAACRNGSTFMVFVGGKLVASGTSAATLVSSGGNDLQIGCNSDGSATRIGHMDEMRITKGACRYYGSSINTTYFTPSTSPGAHFKGPYLAASVGSDALVVGGPSISSAQSKFGGYSLSVNGTSDYLDLIDQAAIGTGNFTIECWIRIASPASSFIILESRNAADSAAGFVFHISASKLAVRTNNVTTAGTTNLAADTWYHVALVRSFGTLRGYLNGVQEFSIANSLNFSLTNYRIGMNYNVSGAYSAGYIDDLRVTVGVGRYAAAFTPPTEAFAG